MPYFILDDFDSSIQTGNPLHNNSAVINDEDGRQYYNDSNIFQAGHFLYKNLPKTSTQIIYKVNMRESCGNLLNETDNFVIWFEDNEGPMNETLYALKKLRCRLQQNIPQELHVPLSKNENITVARINTFNSPLCWIENVNIFT